MVWVFVFGGIALAGLVMLIAYAVWLAHKAADVMSEVRVLGERTGQLFDLVAQVEVPATRRAWDDRAGGEPHSDLSLTAQVSEYPAT